MVVKILESLKNSVYGITGCIVLSIVIVGVIGLVSIPITLYLLYGFMPLQDYLLSNYDHSDLRMATYMIIFIIGLSIGYIWGKNQA